MAIQLPRYVPQVEVHAAAAPRINSAAIEAPYAAAAQGAAKLGELSFRIGTEAAHRTAYLEEHEARSDATMRAAAARLDMTTALVDAQTKAPEGAPEFTPQFLENFDKYSKDTIANAPERARPYLTQHMAGLRDHFGEMAINFEANAHINKRQQDLDKSIDTFANVVRTDPSQFEGALKDASDAVAASGLPADRLHKADTHVKGLLATSMAEGLIDSDGRQAAAMLRDPRFDSFFPPGIKNQLIERNNARMEKQQNADAAAIRADVKERYDNEVAAIRDRGYGVGGLSAGMIQRAFPEQADTLLKNLNTEREFYNARQQVALNSPEQDAAALAKFKPEGEDYALQQSRRDALQGAIVAKQNAATKDPVGYLTQVSAPLRAALDAAAKDPSKLPAALTLSDQLQSQIGLAPHQHFVLSGGQAADLVGKISVAPPEQAAQTIQGLAKTYGERWPAVFGELVGQKLPEGYQVLAAVDPPGARAHLVEAIKTGKKALREAVGPDAKGIELGLHDAMKPFLATMGSAPNGAALGAAWQNGAELLALRYASLGESSDAALKHAVGDMVTAKYDLVQGGGTNARAPKGLGGAAQQTADDMLASLKPDALEIPPRGKDELPLTDAQRTAAYFRDGVQRGAMWITNQKDDGWVLLDSSRQPVTRKGGAAVTFNFADMTAPAAQPSRALWGLAPE